jgi:hypothetical protein
VTTHRYGDVMPALTLLEAQKDPFFEVVAQEPFRVDFDAH